jgi:hypothetical protein
MASILFASSLITERTELLITPKYLFWSVLTAKTKKRHNTENSKQIFPEKELCGFSPQFPHSCVCERFIYFQDRSACSAAGITIYVPLFKKLRDIIFQNVQIKGS